MRNFLEKGFSLPKSSQENHKQEDQPPDPEKRKTLQKLFKISAVAATASFVEPFLNAKDAFSQIESGEFKEIKKGINWASKTAEKELKYVKKFFYDLNLDKVDVPVIIGTQDDLRRGGLEGMIKDARGILPEAEVFVGSQVIEVAPDLAKIMGAKEGYVYMMFKTDRFEPGEPTWFAVHETFHALHYSERILNNPQGKDAFLIHPEMSPKANIYLEEMYTCGQTLDYFEEQQKSGNTKKLLNKKQIADIPLLAAEQKLYMLTNYFNYYREKYPDGEIDIKTVVDVIKPNDPIDEEVNEIFNKYRLFEFLSARKNK